MNAMGENIRESNTTSDNVSYLVGNKQYQCQHVKFNPLTGRKRKKIPETIFRYLEGIITKDSYEWLQPYIVKVTYWLSQLPVKETQFAVHVLYSKTHF